MRGSERRYVDVPPASTIARLEGACDRFEAAWRVGLRPAIEDYWVGPGQSASNPWLLELLTLELAYRLRSGERPTLAEYRRRFPAHTETLTAAFQAVGTDDAAEGNGDRPACAAQRPAPSIAGYTIIGELGRGGMGVVFQARREDLGRVVALKMVLAGDFAGPEAVARLRAEAEAVARLQHPDIVQIYSIGAADGLPFLELEYVAGGSLAQRLDGTP